MTWQLSLPVGRQVMLWGPWRSFPLSHWKSTLNIINEDRVLTAAISTYFELRMEEKVDMTSPEVWMMGWQVIFITRILMEWDCLRGVVHVYWPVSLSSADKMLSLYSKVLSLIGPWAHPWGYASISLPVLLVLQVGVPALFRNKHSMWRVVPGKGF